MNLLLIAAALLLQSTPSVSTYQVVRTAPPPAQVVDQYDAVDCLVADVWSGSFIFCAQPSPTPTPSPTPVVETLQTFDQIPLGKLTGAAGGVDWGPGGVGLGWAVQGPWLGFQTRSLEFSDAVGQGRQFAFVKPSVLAGLDVLTYVAGTLTLTSDAGEVFSVQVMTGKPQTLRTGWLKPAQVVKVEFTGKWALSIDNMRWVEGQ